MAEPSVDVDDPPPVSDPNPSFSPLCNSTSDQTPLGNSMSGLEFMVDGDGEFELSLDGVGELYFPSENESFFIPVDATNQERSGNFTPGSEGSGISGNYVQEDAVRDMNGVLCISGCCNEESPRDFDCCGAQKSLILSTPMSSQESENCGSDVLEATNVSSPKSGNIVVDQKVKVQEAATTALTKRKKEIEEVTSEESMDTKYRRLSEDGAASAVTCEDDEKRNARLIRNRESAQLSRQRKKHYVEELEEKVRTMQYTITDLNSKISYFMAENATLRQQVGASTGIHPPHHPSRPGMYPSMTPMPYPWMPCPAYMVKPQGSQVPSLPIPRLKSQQPLAKVKKSESKRSEAKTKKVASISFLGILLGLCLFGALTSIVNVNYGGISSAFLGGYKSNYVTDRIYDQPRGRVFDVSINSSDTELPNSDRVHCGKDFGGGPGRNISATDESVAPGNGGEPLVASLFVPRNDKLVKIDGNLIIHSILASEKAIVSRKASETNDEGKSRLAIHKDFSPKYLYRTESEKQKALSSASGDTQEDQFRSATTNGDIQQWFREGAAGPMFSSGMCNEVFKFDVSSTSGAIIPASAATNVSSTGQPKNTTDTHKGKKNRRILRDGLPVSNFNLTKDHKRNSSGKENFHETKSAPSMVVSVLADPREVGERDINGMFVGPESVSRVFVVVLVDGVKYVTYSCVLPRSGVPQLVTT